MAGAVAHFVVFGVVADGVVEVLTEDVAEVLADVVAEVLGDVVAEVLADEVAEVELPLHAPSARSAASGERQARNRIAFFI
jgi:hypothetical protein